MRHAKSSWAEAGQRDHDRPLNRRGRKASAAVGAWLKAGGYLPDLALVSNARRCQETWAGVVEEIGRQRGGDNGAGDPARLAFLTIMEQHVSNLAFACGVDEVRRRRAGADADARLPAFAAGPRVAARCVEAIKPDASRSRSCRRPR